MTKNKNDEQVALVNEPQASPLTTATNKTGLAKKALIAVSLVAGAACVWAGASTHVHAARDVMTLISEQVKGNESYTLPPTASNAVTQCASGMVTLQSDIGTFLSRCENCFTNAASGLGPDAVAPWVSDFKLPTAAWTVIRISNNSVALRSDKGKFLSRCNRCISGSSTDDIAFAHVADWVGNPWSIWTIETLANGKVALKSDSGRYLSRCQNCATSSKTMQLATVHVTDPITKPWSQWTVGCLPSKLPRPTETQAVKCEGDADPSNVYRFIGGKLRLYPSPGVASFWDPEWLKFKLVDCSGIPRGPAYADDPYADTPAKPLIQSGSGIIALQSDISTYLARCENCYAKAAPVYSADAVGPWVTDVKLPTAQWSVVRIDENRVALRSDKGKYLSRCYNCISDATFPDLALAHVADWRSGPWAVWTVETLPNGKIALKADSGRYLSRCQGCAASSVTKQLAMIHVTNAAIAPWSQWTVVYVSKFPRPAKEGQPVKCEGDTNPARVYRFTGGKLRWYPNEKIATSWDPEWRTTMTMTDCSGIPRGPPM